MARNDLTSPSKFVTDALNKERMGKVVLLQTVVKSELFHTKKNIAFCIKMKWKR